MESLVSFLHHRQQLMIGWRFLICGNQRYHQNWMEAVVVHVKCPPLDSKKAIYKHYRFLGWHVPKALSPPWTKPPNELSCITELTATVQKLLCLSQEFVSSLRELVDSVRIIWDKTANGRSTEPTCGRSRSYLWSG